MGKRKDEREREKQRERNRELETERERNRERSMLYVFNRVQAGVVLDIHVRGRLLRYTPKRSAVC